MNIIKIEVQKMKYSNLISKLVLPVILAGSLGCASTGIQETNCYTYLEQSGNARSISQQYEESRDKGELKNGIRKRNFRFTCKI